jgi:membrane protease YdiL (CAAX protease family)
LDSVANFGERYLPAQFFTSPGNSLVNPIQYFVLPFLVLLFLGAHPSELGFERGHRSWWVILLWCGIEFALWGLQVLSGALYPLRLLTVFISNFFQNGFFEEFLFRGALQTRLRLLVDPAWSLVLAALIFGLWHLGADVRAAGGDWLGGLALTVRNQAVFGLVMGIIFMRTRNLLACSVVHTVLNTFFTVGVQ